MSMAELALAFGIGTLLSTAWSRHQDEAAYREQAAALEGVLALALTGYRAHCAGSATSVSLLLPRAPARADWAADHGWSATVFTSGAGRLELRGVGQRHAQRLARRFHGRADGGVLQLPLPTVARLSAENHQRRFLRQYATAASDVCALR